MAKQLSSAASEEKLKTDAEPAQERSRIEMLRDRDNRVFDTVHPSDWRLLISATSGFEWQLPRVADGRVFPAANFLVSRKRFVITMELPGLSEANVEVKISNGALILRG